MALLFADGFEDGLLAWAVSGSMAIGTGRFGSGFVYDGGSTCADVGFAPTVGPFIVGFAFKPAGVGDYFASIRDSTGVRQHLNLQRGAGGEIVVSRGGSGTSVLGTTAASVLPGGAWSYVEMRFTIHDTTGTVILRVNGAEVLNLSAKDTLDSSLTANALRFGSPSGNVSMTGINGNAYDDVYLADTTGTYNNTFLGDISVEHLRPASDDTAQMMGSDSNTTNNWDLVNEGGVYSGADYVGSATVGQRDLYVPVPSTRATSAVVAGVIVTAVAQKTDAGPRTVKLAVKEGSGGTIRYSADTQLPTSFGEIRQVFERKGDNSQFTVADVNALRFGVEVAT